MELKFPYIKSKDYELDDDFIIALEKAPSTLSLMIALYIEEHCPALPVDEFCNHVLAGVVHHFDEPITFVFEVSKPDPYLTIFTDLEFIEMDEYLDFVNLNLYLKHDQHFSYPRPTFSRKPKS